MAFQLRGTNIHHRAIRLFRVLRATPRGPYALRWSSSSSTEREIAEILGEPSWSVKSLLPSEEQAAASPQVTPKQLHHLLRLSALPPPANTDEEAKMLKTLNSQLHFVREIQKVDTTGVEPLRSLRDETATEANEITMDDLKEAFAAEEIVGNKHKRIRRRRDIPVDTRGAEDWDVLAYAERKVGRYFVVDSTKD